MFFYEAILSLIICRPLCQDGRTSPFVVSSQRRQTADPQLWQLYLTSVHGGAGEVSHAVIVVVVIVVIVAVVVVFSFVSSSQDRYWSGRAVPGTRMERKEDGESSSVHYLYDE